jgi:tight adherence protein B
MNPLSFLNGLSTPTIVFLILVFAAVASAFQGVFSLVKVGRLKRQVNRRLAVAETTKSLPDLVVELRKQRGLNEKGERKAGWAWFNDLVVRSGVPYQPRRWTLVPILTALAAGMAIFLLSKSAVVALLLAPVAAVGGPILYLQVMAKRRAKRLGEQLPAALEVIVRSLEAGHPVPTAVDLVGKEMADPIGSEFGMAADEIAFGSTLEQAVGRMAERCRHADVDLFAATVRLQEKTGGNLVGLLKMNAATVRERFRMRMKIQAASSEGRASALILTAAPMGAASLLMISSPDYYGSVIGEPFIQIALGVIGAWMGIGNLIMRRMIDMRI